MTYSDIIPVSHVLTTALAGLALCYAVLVAVWIISDLIKLMK